MTKTDNSLPSKKTVLKSIGSKKVYINGFYSFALSLLGDDTTNVYLVINLIKCISSYQ